MLPISATDCQLKFPNAWAIFFTLCHVISRVLFSQFFKNWGCFENDFFCSFAWWWSQPSRGYSLQATNISSEVVKSMEIRLSPFLSKIFEKLQTSIKKNFPNRFFSFLLECAREGVYFNGQLSNFFDNFSKVVPRSRTACSSYDCHAWFQSIENQGWHKNKDRGNR